MNYQAASFGRLFYWKEAMRVLQSRRIRDGCQENAYQFRHPSRLFENKHMTCSFDSLKSCARDLAGKGLGKVEGSEFIVSTTDDQDRGMDSVQAI